MAYLKEVPSTIFWLEQDVSRILFLPNNQPAVVIYLTPWLPKGISDLPAPWNGPLQTGPIWSCSGWGLPCIWCHHQNG